MYIAQYTNSRTKNINRPSTFELSNDEKNIISLQAFINLSAKEQVFHENSEFALVTWLQHQASMCSHDFNRTVLYCPTSFYPPWSYITVRFCIAQSSWKTVTRTDIRASSRHRLAGAAVFRDAQSSKNISPLNCSNAGYLAIRPLFPPNHVSKSDSQTVTPNIQRRYSARVGRISCRF